MRLSLCCCMTRSDKFSDLSRPWWAPYICSGTKMNWIVPSLLALPHCHHPPVSCRPTPLHRRVFRHQHRSQPTDSMVLKCVFIFRESAIHSVFLFIYLFIYKQVNIWFTDLSFLTFLLIYISVFMCRLIAVISRVSLSLKMYIESFLHSDVIFL